MKIEHIGRLLERMRALRALGVDITLDEEDWETARSWFRANPIDDNSFMWEEVKISKRKKLI